MDNYLKLLSNYAKEEYWDNPQEIYEKKRELEDKRLWLKDILLSNDIDENKIYRFK